MDQHDDDRVGAREVLGLALRAAALVAGVGFFSLAVVTQGLLPLVEPQSRSNKVTQVVRTDFGELKWMESVATDYTDQQKLGRQVYIREGCWYCHSQFVRPVTGETRRWGPVRSREWTRASIRRARCSSC